MTNVLCMTGLQVNFGINRKVSALFIIRHPAAEKMCKLFVVVGECYFQDKIYNEHKGK